MRYFCSSLMTREGVKKKREEAVSQAWGRKEVIIKLQTLPVVPRTRTVR